VRAHFGNACIDEATAQSWVTDKSLYGGNVIEILEKDKFNCALEASLVRELFPADSGNTPLVRTVSPFRLSRLLPQKDFSSRAQDVIPLPGWQSRRIDPITSTEKAIDAHNLMAGIEI